ncbi:MAG: amino acid adenylation domain-containing protein [Actinomycetota bacterium]
MRSLLHQLLADSAARHPARVAVVDQERWLTYAELDRRSNQVARQLISMGVRRGDRVGLYLDKSMESVVAIYGTLKAGAAYVPLDPDAPPARLGGIARDAALRVLLTGTEKQATWHELTRHGASLESLVALNHVKKGLTPPPGVRVVGVEEIDRRPDEPTEVEMIHLDLAYILYTSGSTGLPKGVKLSHLNALTFVEWGVETFGLTPGDRLSSHAPLHFDLSVFDLFAAAGAGAAVVLVPREAVVFPIEAARFIESNDITVWYSVPSALTALALRGNLKDGGGRLSTVRTVLFAGEVFPTKYLRQMMQLVPHARFFNLYGPTETNVCTFYEVPPLPEGENEPIPIGRAIANVEVFAVKDDRSAAGVGEVGELYVRGSTVMKGYWGDPERTSRVLVSNPLDDELPDPTYRTGDLVRLEHDGDYRFLGRRDAQIKSRGYRIELGEIETVIYAHPAVMECAVVAIPDEVVTNRLRAYVVVGEGVTEREIVEVCSRRLPRYMIPEHFEFLTSLPKTSTGKIDRQSLRSIGVAPVVG